MKSRFLSIWLLVVLASSLGANEHAGYEGMQRSPSPAGASVSFANVSDGDVLPPAFVVSFSVSGMDIAPAGSDIDYTGHHHLLVNVDEMPAMDLPLPANDNVRHFGKGQTETELRLPEGSHTLQLLLADYRHVPHDPPVKSEVIEITVSKDAPPQQ